MELGGREVSRPQRVAERRIPRVAREATAENLEGALDPAAQFTERAGAFPLGFTGPLLQPAGLRPVVSARCKPGGVGDEPDEHEVGVDLAREHRLEVELEIRLARQRLAVPQDAEPESVRDDRPQVRVAAVEELLHETVGVGGGRPPLPRRAAIEREAAADEMHRHRSEEAPDGIGATADRRTGGDGQEAESELAQERQAPLVVGEAGARLALGEVRGGGREPPVVSAQAVPGVGDRLVQAFAGREPVVFGPGAGKRRTRVENALQEVRRQQSALGADGLELLVGAGHVSRASAAGRRRRGGPPAAPARCPPAPSLARRRARACGRRAGLRRARARRLRGRLEASAGRAAAG